MVHDDDDTGELPELGNRELLKLLMGEIAAVNREIRADIKADIAALASDVHALRSDVHTLSSEVHTLHLEVHQNQATFIRNHENLERRIAVLEAA